jgi:hypothetical protein
MDRVELPSSNATLLPAVAALAVDSLAGRRHVLAPPGKELSAFK